MAPRKKAGKAPETTEAAKPGEVLKMIPGKALASILALDKRTKKDQAQLAGTLGQKIANACETYGTNRKALGVIRTLNRMEPEKLADFLDHFDYMLDVSGLEKRAEAVQRLPMGDGPGEAEVEEPEAPASADGKVSRPHFGARQAAE